MEHVLVMVIPNPGDCAQCTDDDSDVGDRPDDEYQVRVDLIMPEIVHDLENEPAGTGQRAAAVDASEVLR
jgi:hypothetical protein